MSRMTDVPKFRMGKLDHVHIRVPDQAEAAAWYARHLGFELVERDAISPVRCWPREVFESTMKR